jgi:hypothetical protein
VALGQVLVLADQNHRIGPEALGIATSFIRIVIRQASTDAFGLANIRKLPVLRVFVGADQDVDAWPFNLGESFTNPPKLVAPEGNRLDRRHRDLRHPNAVRIAVEQEDINRARFHQSR